MSKKMPMLFIGHGSPMNAIEDTEEVTVWKTIASRIEKPKGILVISAHWYTNTTRVQSQKELEMIYDMYGFPEELYQVTYPAKGDPHLAAKVKDYLGNSVTLDSQRGLDHGAWSVLCNMYPKADIPVVQLSLNSSLKPEEHYEIGKKLSRLREEGILILSSGNIVHNLRTLSWEMEDGMPWAIEFDEYIKRAILSKEYSKVLEYRQHPRAELAVPSPDHLIPLFYVLGASTDEDPIQAFNNRTVMGSLSMTGYLFGAES